MFTFVEYDSNINYRELDCTPGLFHEALKYVLRGESRFHVHNEGAADFDMCYDDNDRYTKADPACPDSDFYKSELFFPPYYFYDETDLEKINMYILDGFQEVFFEEANEYSLVLADLILKHTNLQVTFRDRKVTLFPWLKDKVVLCFIPEKEKSIYVQKSFYPVYNTPDRFCSLGLFHSMFILQWITDLPKKDLKYVELTIRKTEGIGSVLNTYLKAQEAFEKMGIKIYIAPGSTRYTDKLLTTYFKIDEKPEDADETNTAFVKCFNCFTLNNFTQRNTRCISLDVIKPALLNDMKEYADLLLGNKKTLGVLLRGTDFIIANFENSFHPGDIDRCISLIAERMEKYNYDRIFVATEDDYYLSKMLKAFPHKIITVSQERHKVEDFKNLKYISDLEKETHSEEAYQASVEDTTVNYIYAMYMLSRCESFLANCICNGVWIAEAFNEGKFIHKDIVSMMDDTQS